MALIRKLTAEEFLARGHEWPRGTQLIRGEVVVNQPAWLHQRVLGQLYVLLRAWCDARSGRGEVGLSLDLPTASTTSTRPTCGGAARTAVSTAAPASSPTRRIW